MADQEQALGLKELDDVLQEIVTLLKNPAVSAGLAERGVNVSLAITAAEGLGAYVHGDKARAIDDLGTVAEEIKARLAINATNKAEKPS